MDGSIRLAPEERKVLLMVYRAGDARLSRRAHVLLLLDDGLSYRDLRAFLYASNDLIADCVRRFRKGGIHDALEPDGKPTSPEADWFLAVQDWLRNAVPQDFGYFRQRWTCEMLAEVLAWEKGIHLSAETVRRRLHRAGFVWRRPRPVVGPTDPDYAEKKQRLSRLLAQMPEDETVVFEDEVDIHLNPKIGSCWMPRGEQSEVVTPGTNDKRHLAGSFLANWNALISEPGRYRTLNSRSTSTTSAAGRVVIAEFIIQTNPLDSCRLSGSTWSDGVIELCSIFCPSMLRKRIRSSGYGGTCTRQSPATTDVALLMNCWTMSTHGSTLREYSHWKSPYMAWRRSAPVSWRFYLAGFRKCRPRKGKEKWALQDSNL